MATEKTNAVLPRDVIISILKRLPVKTILRCRCVCKDWKNLFKTPYFIKEHYHHSAQKNPLLIYSTLLISSPHRCSPSLLTYKNESWAIERITGIDCLRHGYTILGACTGLICVKLYKSTPTLMLLNPATKEVRQIPKSSINSDDDYYRSHVGFGFSPVVNDYKIVRVHTTEKCIRRAEVYSLRAGSWKDVEVLESLSIQVEPVTAFGVVYWLEWRSGEIVAFDLAMECFRVIPLPTNDDDTHQTDYARLGAYKDNVAMLKGYIRRNYGQMDLWVLEESSGACEKSWSWTKKYSIGPIAWFLYPLCFWRNEIVCQNLGYAGLMEHDMAPYNLFNLTTNNELKKFRISESSHNINELFNYVESLVPLYGT